MKIKIISIITLIFIVLAGFKPLFGQGSTQKSDEAKTIRLEAEEVITEYNRTAESVKYEAIKNNKNLTPEVKKTIVDLENKVSQLEDKLDNINYQNNESWTKLREEIKSDIATIRKGVKNLTNS